MARVRIISLPQMKKGGWIQGAIKKSHVGFCTPMTKATCTPRRKALARTLKKHHGFHENGGMTYQNGGNIIDYLNKTNQTNYGMPAIPAIPASTFGANAVAPNMSLQQPNVAFNPDPMGDHNNPATFPNPTNTSNTILTKVQQQPKAPFNWNMVGRQALQNLPIFAQMAINAQGDPFLQHNPNTGLNDAMGLAQQLPEDVSISGQLAANDRSYNEFRDTQNPMTRSEAATGLATKISGDNQAYTQQQAANTQLKSTKLNALANLATEQGGDFQNDRGRYLDTASKNQAARDNNFSAGLSRVVNNELQAGNDTETIKALNSMTHMIDIDPYAKQMLKDDPNANAYIFQVMLSGKGAISYDQAKEQYYRITGKKDPSKDETKTQDKTYNTTRQKGNIYTITNTNSR